MSAARYAADTSVSSKSSRDEIERTVTRYGASDFAFGISPQHATVGFAVHDRVVRFTLPMPDRRSREFTHTPGRGYERDAKGAEQAYEQAVRQRWRALALIVKAKLEAVEAGIVTFEQEFLPHIVIPGTGQTVYENARPALAAAYEHGGPAGSLLQIGAAS